MLPQSVCVKRVAVPEDGQECSGLVGDMTKCLLAKIKELVEFAAHQAAHQEGGSCGEVFSLQPGLQTCPETCFYCFSFIGNACVHLHWLLERCCAASFCVSPLSFARGQGLEHASI